MTSETTVYNMPQNVYDTFQAAMPLQTNFGWVDNGQYFTSEAVAQNLIDSGIDLDAITQAEYTNDFFPYMNANHVMPQNVFDGAVMAKSMDYNNQQTWVHTHNFGRKAAIMHVSDGGGNWIHPDDISSITDNNSQVTINFTSPKTGFFYFM